MVVAPLWVTYYYHLLSHLMRGEITQCDMKGTDSCTISPTCNTFTHAPLHTHDCSNDHHWHEHVDVCTTLFPQSSSVVFVGLNGVRALPLAVELLATINGIL